MVTFVPPTVNARAGTFPPPYWLFSGHWLSNSIPSKIRSRRLVADEKDAGLLRRALDLAEDGQRAGEGAAVACPAAGGWPSGVRGS